MPHVIVKMWPGPTEQAKQQLAEAITRDVMTHANVARDSVSVSIEEVSPQDWTAKVYDPDIAGKPDSLYKQPGYKRL
jgi:4-oxalocrotonate tautomerase